jgi:hypothetical protein
MALPTLLLLAVFVGAYALYRYWDTSRRHRIPQGLKPLPGPKGMSLSHWQGVISVVDPVQR